VVILITRPNYDPGTNYLFYWSKSVIDFADRRKVKVLDLSGEKANKKDFVSYIRKHNPKFVFFNGHGNERSVMRQDDMVLADLKDSPIFLGAIIYARSCEAAQKLGPQCVIDGALAFIGYTKKFTVGYTPEKVTRPLEDPVAKLFLEPSNLIPVSVLKGNSVQSAHLKSQKAMFKNLMFMLSSAASNLQKDSASYLWRNMKYQTVCGDKNAKI
jgi:hypothetical protein